jgi:hypothetical protein
MNRRNKKIPGFEQLKSHYAYKFFVLFMLQLMASKGNHSFEPS